MGSVYYLVPAVSRIFDTSKVAQGADDADVTGWTKTNEFIWTAQLDCEKGPIARAYKLQWRNVTQAGTFADVASTGEIAWGATITDDQTDATQRCTNTPGGSTWDTGYDNSGDNLQPDSGTISVADEDFIELHWNLDPSGATDGEEYAFQVYDVTETTALGEMAATITMEPGATTFSLLFDRPPEGGIERGIR